MGATEACMWMYGGMSDPDFTGGIRRRCVLHEAPWITDIKTCTKMSWSPKEGQEYSQKNNKHEEIPKG